MFNKHFVYGTIPVRVDDGIQLNGFAIINYIVDTKGTILSKDTVFFTEVPKFIIQHNRLLMKPYMYFRLLGQSLKLLTKGQ